MNHPIDTAITESPIAAQAAAVVSDEGVLSRRLGPMFWIAVGWIVLVVLAAILAPWLPLKDPNKNYIDRSLGRPPYPPSSEFWFGTDKDARDMFSRTIWGARISLTVGFVAIACGMLIGGSFGVLAGHFRGWWDRLVSFVFVVLLSFPALVLAILITTLVDRSLFTISVTLGLLAIAPVGRLARATTIQFSEREFVVAARTLGASNRRINVRELLPNVVIPMGALALLGMAVAIVAEGALAFLGLSIEKGQSWGKLILFGAESSRVLNDSPWVAFAPISVLFLTVAALNFCGDKVRAHFDVKEATL
jgi:peptide/nickel transport system permease protein